MAQHRIFCSICKEHIVITAESRKDAMKQFSACGHDDKRVRMLRHGLPGFYESETNLRREMQEGKRSKKSGEIRKVIYGGD